MTILLRLKVFCNNVNEPIGKSPPHSYESYVKAVQQCIQPFIDYLILKEEEIVLQCASNTTTILTLQRDMNPFFQYLQDLYKIHLAVTLDYNQIPGKGQYSYPPTYVIYAGLRKFYFTLGRGLRISVDCYTL